MQEINATEAAYDADPLSGAVAASSQCAILLRAPCEAVLDDQNRRTRSLSTARRKASIWVLGHSHAR
jgi:hypothetical protein